MKKSIRFVAVIAAVLFAFAFASCNDSGSSDGDSGSGSASSSSFTETSSFDSKLAGGTYSYTLTSIEYGYTFNSDYSVKQITAGTSIALSNQKWRIVDNGKTVEIYTTVTKTVTASFTVVDDSFTKLKMGGQTYTRK